MAREEDKVDNDRLVPGSRWKVVHCSRSNPALEIGVVLVRYRAGDEKARFAHASRGDAGGRYLVALSGNPAPTRARRASRVIRHLRELGSEIFDIVCRLMHVWSDF